MEESEQAFHYAEIQQQQTHEQVAIPKYFLSSPAAQHGLNNNNISHGSVHCMSRYHNKQKHMHTT